MKVDILRGYCSLYDGLCSCKYDANVRNYLARTVVERLADKVDA